jgi:hypothetical protein
MNANLAQGAGTARRKAHLGHLRVKCALRVPSQTKKGLHLASRVRQTLTHHNQQCQFSLVSVCLGTTRSSTTRPLAIRNLARSAYHVVPPTCQTHRSRQNVVVVSIQTAFQSRRGVMYQKLIVASAKRRACFTTAFANHFALVGRIGPKRKELSSHC